MNNIASKIRWILKGQDGASATLQTFLSRVLILGLNIGTGVITARFLGPEGRGEQSAIILWPLFLAYTLTLGLPSALVYNLKCHPEKKSSFFSAALVWGTLLGFVAMLVGIVFIPHWLSKYSSTVIRDAQWMMLFAPMAMVSTLNTAILESQGKFAVSNQSRNLGPLMTLMVLVGLASTRTLTPLTSSLAYILPGIPIFIWVTYQTWQLMGIYWQGFRIASRKLFSYGIRSYGIDLLGTLGAQIDQALVIGLLQPEAMGLYAVALSLSRMLNVFQASIVTVLFPTVAARPLKEVVHLTGQVARVSLFLTTLVGIIVIMLGHIVLQTLYGIEFLGAVPAFRILIIEIMLASTTMILAQAFMALGRPGIVTVLQGTGLGLSVPLMLVLIPNYGLVGASLALLISTTARLLFILINFPLVLKVYPPNLLITQEDIKFLIHKVRAV